MPKLTKVYSTPVSGHYFFGYYDKSALDAENKLLLAQQAQFVDRNPVAGDSVTLGVFDWAKCASFVPFAQSRAWNWQQGCMLQWLGPDYKSSVIYNDLVGDKYVSIKMDLSKGTKTVLPKAIYTVHPSAKLALCIDNERHYWFREGYNYQGIVNPKKKAPVDPDDGIWALDIESGQLKQIVNIGQLLQISPLASMVGAVHFVEHLMFSPNGARFCFLHRWRMPNGVVYSRLYTAAPDGKELYLLNDSGRISHFCWESESTLIVWAALATPINILRKYKISSSPAFVKVLAAYKKIFKGNSVDGNTLFTRMINGDSYLRLYDKSPRADRVLASICNRDGHPSVVRQTPTILLTDTYPNPNDNHQISVMLCDLVCNKVVSIIKLKSDANSFGQSWRADAHPKISLDGKYVAVDFLLGKRRGISLYSIS